MRPQVRAHHTQVERRFLRTYLYVQDPGHITTQVERRFLRTYLYVQDPGHITTQVEGRSLGTSLWDLLASVSINRQVEGRS